MEDFEDLVATTLRSVLCKHDEPNALACSATALHSDEDAFLNHVEIECGAADEDLLQSNPRRFWAGTNQASILLNQDLQDAQLKTALCLGGEEGLQTREKIIHWLRAALVHRERVVFPHKDYPDMQFTDAVGIAGGRVNVQLTESLRAAFSGKEDKGVGSSLVVVDSIVRARHGMYACVCVWVWSVCV